MISINAVCVFCGANSGNLPVFTEAAETVGKMISRHHIRLIYGGGKVGLMGKVADAALSAQGYVIGIIPFFLGHKEVAHEGAQELISLSSMHERKARMYELSDAFIALPGGFGTLDELFEIITWAQLGLHAKPVGLLNVNGYFTPLLQMVDNMVTNGFLKPELMDLIIVDEDAERLLQKMREYTAPETEKWMNKPFEI
ncbi:MAG: TIGR00730 family Rossman fold protein [Bacteroidia bacterium]|nr:TIGR00730 family Rossman fold protein [Bacteroidia bacterium]